MSENDFALDLEQVATCKRTDVAVQIAQPGGTEREIKIGFEFELLPVDEYEDLKRGSTVAECVERLLKSVTGVPSAKRGDVTYTPLQTAVLVTDICQAIWGEIEVRYGREGRERQLAAYERGNSKRSRKR